jgi:hypothetical protein
VADEVEILEIVSTGWPPLKNEARSMFAADHGYADRVRTLLECTHESMKLRGWNTVDSQLALDVVVRGPGRPSGDATNFLGGIGDVLQARKQRLNIDLGHLGALADVAAFDDDSQIRQITYQEELAPTPSYTVRIRSLNSPGHTFGQPDGERSSHIAVGKNRGEWATAAIAARGTELGFAVKHEYSVPGGRLDLVWLTTSLTGLTGDSDGLPIVGFEIESSWRTRKHLKGDYLNLHDLGAALGILVMLGDSDEVEAIRQFARGLVARPGPKILVWSDRDVHALIAGSQVDHMRTGSALVDRRIAANAHRVRHVGKFRALSSWLASQEGDRLIVTFADLEQAIGLPLPPSCRRHPAHWSSYEGSAVARAIRDAGWTATRVNLREERLSLVRDPAARNAE